MTSSPSSSPRFSLLAVIFRTTQNKITSRRFQLHLRKAAFFSGISLHLFIFAYSPAFTICQVQEANLRVPCCVKTLQYRVRKRVHEGKPRAANSSRVNPITVQRLVDKCYATTITIVQWRTQKISMGDFIQWHVVLIYICYALFVTSQFDVIFMFPNQRFGEVC